MSSNANLSHCGAEARSDGLFGFATQSHLRQRAVEQLLGAATDGCAGRIADRVAQTGWNPEAAHQTIQIVIQITINRLLQRNALWRRRRGTEQFTVPSISLPFLNQFALKFGRQPE